MTLLNEADKIYIGSLPADRIYAGANLVWQAEADTGPLVQSAEGTSSDAATTIAFASVPAAGNLIVLGWSGEAYSYFGTPDAGWTQATTSRGDNSAYIWWRIADGSTNSFTYTMASAARSVWTMAEFSGLDQIDVAAMDYQLISLNNLVTSPAITPTTGERLIVAYLAASDSGPNANSDDDFTAWLNGFTHIRSVGFTSGAVATMGGLAYRIVDGDDSTAYSTGATLPNATVRSYPGIAAFKAVGNLSASAAPNFRAVSSIAYGTRTNTTVDKPTGTVDGDIMLAAVFQGHGSSPPPLMAPVDWKLLLQSIPYVTDGGFYGKTYLYWKRASSEGADYTWTHSSSSTQAAITSWSGCVASGTPVDGWTYNASNISNSGRWGQIRANSTNYRLVAIDHNWTGGANDPIGVDWTEHFDTTLLKIQSRTMAARGDSSTITRPSDAPWEGYLVGLRGL